MDKYSSVFEDLRTTNLRTNSPGVPSATLPKNHASSPETGLQVEFLGNFGPLRPMWSYNALTAGSVTTLEIVADGSTVYDSDATGYVYRRNSYQACV